MCIHQDGMFATSAFPAICCVTSHKLRAGDASSFPGIRRIKVSVTCMMSLQGYIVIGLMLCNLNPPLLCARE